MHGLSGRFFVAFSQIGRSFLVSLVLSFLAGCGGGGSAATTGNQDSGGGSDGTAGSSKTDQIITFVNPGPQIMGSTPTLTASSDSGLVVSFSSATTDVCTITTAGALTLISSGDCTINADQAGDSTYAPALQVSETFSVVKAEQAALTVIATPASILVNEESNLSTNGGSGAGEVSYVVVDGAASCSLKGTIVRGTSVGTCSIKATKAATATYHAATATVTIDVTEGSGSSQLAPDSDAPPITAAPGTALHHAQMCAQYLGPIPEMSCGDAAVAPITVNGIAVSQEVDTCDKPNALTGSCVPGEATSARYQGTYHSGLPRPEVTFINFCRAGGMGVIGHNSETGATCFFSKIDNEIANDVPHPGSDNPDSNYDDYWATAQEVASEGCADCHQSDPWIHSPWIDQLADPDDPTKTLIPATGTKTSPYIVIGDDFSQPYHEGAPDNTCTSCHKPQCDDLFAVKLGELSMPGPFNNHDHVIGVTPDLQELRDWCGTIPRVIQIGGGNEDGGDDDADGTCDAFFDCSESCASDDYECVNTCGTNNLSGSALSSAQALTSCMQSYGCALDDDSCSERNCGPETDSLVQSCGF